MILGAHGLGRISEEKVENPILLEFALVLPLAATVTLDKFLVFSGCKVSEVEARRLGIDPKSLFSSCVGYLPCQCVHGEPLVMSYSFIIPMTTNQQQNKTERQHITNENKTKSRH